MRSKGEPLARNKISKTPKTSFVANRGDRRFQKIFKNRGENLEPSS